MNPPIERLRQRKIVQWALAYLAGAWLFYEAFSLVAQNLGWPAGAVRVVTVLLPFGLLFVLTLAWYHGEQGRQRASGAELLILASLLVLTGFGVRWVRGVPAPSSADPVPAASGRVAAHDASIAVLPFESLSERDDEYFSDGITEEIISELAKVPSLKVISRTSVMALKGSRLTLPEIADTLGVRHILEGSVRRAGTRVRVTVQLIDAASDAHLWADSYDLELSDILAMQDEIATRVASQLVRSVATPPAHGIGGRPIDPAAYDAYLRATRSVAGRAPEQLLDGIHFFQQAIAADPAFAPAYAGLAEAYTGWASWGYGGSLDPFEAMARATILADRAVALAPAAADGYMVRGATGQWALADSAAVFADLRRALELQPNSGKLRIWYATALEKFGLFAAALEQGRLATQLDPLSPHVRYAFSGVALAAGRPELTLLEAERAQLLEPTLGAPKRRRLQALILLGRYGECLRHAEGTPLGYQAACHLGAGDTAAAEAILERTRSAEFQTRAQVSEFEALAAHHARLGDVDAAIHWLRAGARVSPFILNPRVTGSAFYEPVRSVPRFRLAWQELEDEIRSRIEAERRRIEADPRLLLTAGLSH